MWGDAVGWGCTVRGLGWWVRVFGGLSVGRGALVGGKSYEDLGVWVAFRGRVGFVGKKEENFRGWWWGGRFQVSCWSFGGNGFRFGSLWGGLCRFWRKSAV